MRLYTKGKFVGYQRGQRTQNPSTALISVEGVQQKEDTSFYLGKRVAFIYRGHKQKQGTKIRVIWGKIARPHGNSGLFRARFRSNLPPQAMGATLRVMLYPSRV